MKKVEPIPVTAIFDIGKTNKKFLLFDESYSIVQKQQTILEQGKDEDGDSCENLGLLKSWIKDKIRSALENKKIQIRSLNFSTYGASLVHLGESGKVVTPLYNYLKPYPEDLLQQFYETYGGKKRFSLESASPPMGMLNSGLQLYWLKHEKPLMFREIKHTLHFPQYLSYIFTGKLASELTSIGCHTALWNFKEGNYHKWLDKDNEDVIKLLPEIQPVSAANEITYQNSRFKAGIGLHDSSAALAPYLYALDEPFMLISTGTWSITFNPFNTDSLTYRELQKDCLCYLNIYGDKVKSARFFLGNEYMHQKRKLDEYFNRESWEENIEPDAGLFKNLINLGNPAKKLKLETAYNSGPYPQDKPGKWQIEEFSSYEEAYHQLMLDLVSIQADAVHLAQGSKTVDTLIVTGGFSRNNFFLILLAAFFPDKKIYTTSLSHASALGAAMVVNDHPGVKNFPKDILELKQHSSKVFTDVGGYSWKHPVAS